MTVTPIVRRSTAEDDDAVAHLFEQYRAFYRVTPDLARSREFLRERRERGESLVWIALLDGKAVGFTQLYPVWSSLHCRRVWMLNDLFVSESARGRGVGAALLAAAKEHAVATDAKYVVLTTEPHNAPARRLYERAGYRHEKEFIDYVLDL
ncbi:MAG TPA: GNAT family N-acetyltransferase [Gemmatimonadaceae bacterium]|nr:GNAT family N-acetyltransferase [Gemmatimonadaceae bacterium]